MRVEVSRAARGACLVNTSSQVNRPDHRVSLRSLVGMNTAPKLPALIAGRYQPVRLIAKGGMGAVYEVEHARTGEHLALKVLLSGVGATAEGLERLSARRAPLRASRATTSSA